MVKVISLNSAIIPGTVIPMTQDHGNIGRWIEDDLEDKGYKVNRGKGIDLPKYGLEIKSRLRSSTSGHTVGAMLSADIINTPWEYSNIRDKIQRQYRVEYDENILTGDNVVTEAKVYDFTCNEIQSKLKAAWEYGQAVLDNYALVEHEHKPKYIRGDDHWSYFEKQERGQYQYRITPGAMEHIKKVSTNTNNRLFEFGA